MHVTDAIFEDGVLKPLARLDLREHEQVRLIVHQLDGAGSIDRARAMNELRAGIASMGFRSVGSYPTRDELHDRG